MKENTLKIADPVVRTPAWIWKNPGLLDESKIVSFRSLRNKVRGIFSLFIFLNEVTQPIICKSRIYLIEYNVRKKVTE